MKNKQIEKMYRIELFDGNAPSGCSGTYYFFVEDLEEFEKHWLPLAARYPEQVERYYRSKLGEVVTDYYSDDPKFNIVQSEEAEIITTGKMNYCNKHIDLINSYWCEGGYEFDKLTITQMVIKYGKEYYLVGQYEGHGCKHDDPIYNRWYEKEVKYSQMHFYGNPVAEYTCRDINWDDWDKDDAFKDFYTDNKEFFKHDTVKTFVWLPIKKVDKDYKIKALTKQEIQILMVDIIGEAG